MLAVVKETQRLKAYLGGTQNEKILLPTLIGYCSGDELEVTIEATKIMISILSKAPAEYVEVVKKLSKI